MKTVCVKSLLLMITCIFTAHASDKQTLLFTQQEYFKMSQEKLDAVKKGLEKNILEIKKEVDMCEECPQDCRALLSWTPCCLALQFLYPWYATRPQRAELSKVKLALIKKMGEGEKHD